MPPQSKGAATPKESLRRDVALGLVSAIMGMALGIIFTWFAPLIISPGNPIEVLCAASFGLGLGLFATISVACSRQFRIIPRNWSTSAKFHFLVSMGFGVTFGLAVGFVVGGLTARWTQPF